MQVPSINPTIIESSEKPVLRTYKAPWRGELVLACTKCQRKLKKQKGTKAFANVKKWLKRRANSAESAPEIKVVGVDCLKACPKRGVTIARQHQLGSAGSEISIIRCEADLEGLYALVADEQSPRKLSKTA